MADVVLLYEIFSDQAILSGGSWQLPLSNLQTADIAQVARSTNAANSSTIINFNLGSIQPIGGVAFGPANLSPGATWRLRLYSNAAMTVLTYDSGLLTVTGEVINWADPNQWLDWENPGFWNGVADYLSFNELPQFNYHIIPVASAVRWRSAMPWRTAGAVTSSAWTTTAAGSAPPGNAAWMRS